METRKIGIQKSQTVIIGDKAIEIKEITIDNLLALFGYKSFSEIAEIKPKEAETIATYIERMQDTFKMSTGLSFDDLMKLSPSQLKELYEIFKDVNSVFFSLINLAGQNDMLKMVKSLIIQEFVKLFASYQKRDMQTVSNTATRSQLNVSSKSKK